MASRSLISTLTVLLLIACTSTLLAQSGFTTLWGGPLAHRGVGVVTTNGNWLTAITEYRGTALRHGARLASFNQQGGLVQSTALDLGSNIFLQAILNGNTGHYLIGSRMTPDNNRQQGLVVKLNADLTLAWTSTLDLEWSNQLLGAALLPDGGLVVCGSIADDTGKDALVARISPTGQWLWDLLSDQALDDEARGIAVDATHAMVTGSEVDFSGNSNVLFMRISLQGQLAWSTSWGGDGNDLGNAILRMPDGHFVMAGSTSSFGPTDALGQRRNNLHLIKINANGDTLWTRSVGNGTHDVPALCLAMAPNGDLLAAGMHHQAGSSDAMCTRFNSAGTQLWQKLWNTGKEEKLLALVADADGLVAAGWSFGEQGMQLLLLKRNSSGD